MPTTRREDHPKVDYPPVDVPTAAAMFDRAPRTIKYHINKGHLTYIKLGGEFRGVYLIDFASLIELYGQPNFLPPSWIQKL